MTNKGVFMKFLITLSLSLFAFGALAQEDLNAMKQKATSHIDSKMSSLQTARGCINNANTMDKFKACKYDMKHDMKMQKMEAKEEMKDLKESED
jgi:hypothetical protein